MAGGFKRPSQQYSSSIDTLKLKSNAKSQYYHDAIITPTKCKPQTMLKEILVCLGSRKYPIVVWQRSDDNLSMGVGRRLEVWPRLLSSDHDISQQPTSPQSSTNSTAASHNSNSLSSQLISHNRLRHLSSSEDSCRSAKASNLSANSTATIDQKWLMRHNLV